MFSDDNEMQHLFMELMFMTEEERKEKNCVLFIVGKGFLNGQEAFTYLKENLKGTTGEHNEYI